LAGSKFFLDSMEAHRQNRFGKLRWSGARLTLVVVGVTLLAHLPASAQSRDASSAHQPVAGVQKPSFTVNPLTGQVSASASDYEPLTNQQRWHLYFTQTYASVGAYAGPVFSAGFDQATREPDRWGGGFRGYARRLGSRMGSDVIEHSVQAPVAALLKEDTRYIVSGQHGFLHRAGHVLLYTLFTYNAQGRRTLNIANLAGNYAASAASALWLPGRRDIPLFTLTDGSTETGLGVVVNMVQEFWPEIHHKLLHLP